ncbi:MAG: rane dipeptidase [Sphingomonadales bacterium]|nr:rane dipeptidase [Sphingomonadales bacterium]
MGNILKLAGLIVVFAPAMASAQPVDRTTQARIERVLKTTPLIDGHNDLPWELRNRYGSRVETTDITKGSDKLVTPLMTDMARLHAGHVGGQFWSVYIPANVTGPAAVQMTIEQIDIVHRLVTRHPGDLEMAYTAADIVRIHKAGRIASLIGIEGGHQIGNNLAALRQFYALGARYMTLAHFLNNDWADSATDDPVHHGLTGFGKQVVREMNRIGMMVDLSHVSSETMKAALSVTTAPVIFSHSDARALNDHPRNVPDEVLKLVAANGGVVMVNFYPAHLSTAYFAWATDRAGETARTKALYTGQPDRAKAALGLWEKAHPAPVVSIATVADHIDHIVQTAGHDHVGIGGDLDGIEATIPGLGGVDGYPNLFAELIRRDWSDGDLGKLAGGNLLRVMHRVEAIAAAGRMAPPEMSETKPVTD